MGKAEIGVANSIQTTRSKLFDSVSGKAMAEDYPITRLLLDWRKGRHEALDEVMPRVYDTLHRIALKYMRQENPGHTLQPTAIVSEAYIRLIDVEIEWHDRAHFIAVTARLMRRILVDHAKAKHRDKRGGTATKISIDEITLRQAEPDIDVVELDRAMQRLAEFDERKSKIVELHYFGGLNYDETAEVLQISAATVDRDLRMAKAWLHRALSEPA
jgi:RNA polymerase sigma factor (TIGR02999 family)